LLEPIDLAISDRNRMLIRRAGRKRIRKRSCRNRMILGRDSKEQNAYRQDSRSRMIIGEVSGTARS
jgi:hypothetical protein